MRSLGNSLALPLVAVLLTWVATARPARAADDAIEAEALIRQGVQLRIQGNAEGALPLFEKAYQTSRSPRTAAQLGLVELELGHSAEAERYLTEALASPEHPFIAKNRTTLKRQLEAAKRNVGELVVTGSPVGAEIWVNHKVSGRLPLAKPIRLDKGEVDIEVRATGYQTTADTATITAGKQEHRGYALTPTPTPTPVVAAAPERPETSPPAFAGETGATNPAASETLKSSPPPASNGITRRQVAWATAGAAVAALAFGTIEAINAAGKRDTFNNHTSDLGGVPYQDCGTASLSAACRPLKSAYDQALTLSVVGFVAAAVLASGASALFLLSGPNHTAASDAGSSAHAFGCVPDPVSRGLTCNLRF